MRKVLDEAETYLLDTDYAIDPTNVDKLRLSNTSNSIAERTYQAVGKDNQPVQINIQAIVGKNGDGKSTIIELMLRVLNNFACYFGFAYDHDMLCPIKDLCAILYFEADSKVYAIKREKDSKISIYKNGVELNIISGAERCCSFFASDSGLLVFDRSHSWETGRLSNYHHRSTCPTLRNYKHKANCSRYFAISG